MRNEIRRSNLSLLGLVTFLCFHFQEISPYQLRIGFWTLSLLNVLTGTDQISSAASSPPSTFASLVLACKHNLPAELPTWYLRDPFPLGPELRFICREVGNLIAMHSFSISRTRWESAEGARLDSNESVFEASWRALWWLPVDSLLTLTQVF